MFRLSMTGLQAATLYEVQIRLLLFQSASARSLVGSQGYMYAKRFGGNKG